MNINEMTVWVLAAIVALKGKYNGAHTAITGLSGAFYARFGVRLFDVERDSAEKFIRITGPLAAMVESGKVAARPVKGGYMLYDGAAYRAAQSQRQDQNKAAQAAKYAELARQIDAAAGFKGTSAKR
jgi:hypothetical protein